jgi:ABC-2 type transport system ATP-binding protein
MMALLKLGCMEMLNSIEIRGVSKKYASVDALNKISIDIRRGEIFGVIGPDGAGKTTLFRILSTLILPDSGDVSIEGFDIREDYKEIRKIIGYMPGKFSLYGDLSVNENLSFFASVFNVSVDENYYLIEDIFKDIAPFGSRKASRLSGGMKQKLALSCALIHKPSVLFLDEPTTGVDPVSRREFWQILDRLNKMGITIVVSTSYMDEALLCDRIALIKEGVILNSNTPAGVVSSFKNKLLAVWGDDMPTLLKELRSFDFINSVYSFGHEHHLSVNINNFSSHLIENISTLLKDRGHTNFHIKEINPGIEDCYMEFASKGAAYE